MDHLQPFGAPVFFRDYMVQSKLHPRYREARLLGYQPGTTYYRLLDLKTGKTMESRDVKFALETPATQGDPVVPQPENTDLPYNLDVDSVEAR
jgi:hypothetical protein